jgi:hypothetical protein
MFYGNARRHSAWERSGETRLTSSFRHACSVTPQPVSRLGPRLLLSASHKGLYRVEALKLRRESILEGGATLNEEHVLKEAVIQDRVRALHSHVVGGCVWAGVFTSPLAFGRVLVNQGEC